MLSSRRPDTCRCDLKFGLLGLSCIFMFLTLLAIRTSSSLLGGLVIEGSCCLTTVFSLNSIPVLSLMLSQPHHCAFYITFRMDTGITSGCYGSCTSQRCCMTFAMSWRIQVGVAGNTIIIVIAISGVHGWFCAWKTSRCL